METATTLSVDNVEEVNTQSLGTYMSPQREITLSNPPMSVIPDYAAFQHLVSLGECGTSEGNFLLPHSVTVQEDTGHVFVTDRHCSRIQIFSETGYVNQFGDTYLLDPCGVLIHEDIAYVTDSEHHAIFKFYLPSFSFIKRVGTQGLGNEEFDCPGQLAISPNKYLYVTDECNNRLQILNYNLVFRGSLRHQSMTRPVDIKFTFNQMLVLSIYDNPCFHIFTPSGEKIRSFLTRGKGLQVYEAYFFCLDAHKNIIISDRLGFEIKVFSPEGDLLHTIGEPGQEPGMLCGPRGVALLKKTKLVSVSEKIAFVLEIYSA